MRSVHCLAIAMALAACGDDGGSGNNQAAGGGGPPKAAPAKPGAALRQMTRVEDRATTEHEKLSIRHVFKERDFSADLNRDPFQPYIIILQGLGPEPVTTAKSVANCEPDKMQASGYSYNDLKLVGIVAQGTQRKALVEGGGMGYIIKRLDCVGREKAIVDEISDGYVRLKIKAEPSLVGAPDRPAETHDLELHPKELALNGPVEPGRMPPVPDVPLPSGRGLSPNSPPPAPPTPKPPTTMIIPGTPPRTTPPPSGAPAMAPTDINP